MKRNTLGFLSLGILAGGLIFAAQSRGQPGTTAAPGGSANSGSGVAVIDLVRIFNECQQIRDLNELIRRKETDIQTEAGKRREVIEKTQLELSAFKPGTPDFERRKKELMRLNIEANVWLETARQDLEVEKFDWTRIVYEHALQIAEQIAAERGYDVILQYKAFKPTEIEQTVTNIRRVIQDRTVVFARSDRNITDQVIRRLDDQYRAAGGKNQLSPPAGSTTPVP